VIADDSFAAQAAMSSSVHQLWAITYGATMSLSISYSVSDVFETLPRPASSDRLERAGKVLDDVRRDIMLRRELGLTSLYNLVNDATVLGDTDVGLMREIHAELDEATMEAYGWADFPLNHGFHVYRQIERFTVSPAARVEMLDRLLEENHRRAAAEGDSVRTQNRLKR
jgi:hypothetical protein